MRILIALGGNALLKRGEAMAYETELNNVRKASHQILSLYRNNELIITHGNGPQVGLIALQQEAFKDVTPYPLDAMGAQSIGLIGYMIQKELTGLLGADSKIASVLTQTEVLPDDPAFTHPTKPVGPVYDKITADQLVKDHGWSMARDNDHYRRVVASPDPKRILGLSALKTLVESGHLVICCGGGGIPVYFGKDGELLGAEAVIDKDLASSLLASSLSADLFIIATDVKGIYHHWAKPDQKMIRQTSPSFLRKEHFAAGSMGPKVQAVCRFVEKTGRTAVIGSLEDINDLAQGRAGTRVGPDLETVFAS